MKKKILAIVLAVVILATAIVVGTLAWLYDKEADVVDTFTVGKVYISITDAEDKFHVIPGDTDTGFDAAITVEDDSEDCYVFVKVTEDLGGVVVNTTAGETFQQNVVVYALDGWDELPDVAVTNADGTTTRVYYKTVAKTATGEARTLNIIKDNSVTYPNTLTNANLAGAQNSTEGGANGTDLPSLTYTAYACQQLKANGTTHTAAEAWDIVKDLT